MTIWRHLSGDGERRPPLQPVLRPTRRSEATAYHYIWDRGGSESGWAICTVNDASGELFIQSDWTDGCGHRWNIDHLGAPSLTHFLARYVDDNSYLVGKLLRPERRRVFSSDLSAAIILRRLLEKRRSRAIDASEARAWWDEVEGLYETEPANFHAALPEGLAEALEIEPWYETYAEEETTEAWALRTVILPALARSCREEVARRALVAAHGPQHAPEASR